jgi:hypothetical protein
MIAQKQFQRHAPGFVNLIRLAFDLHSVLNHSRAGWDEPTASSTFLLEFHHAHHAGSGRLTLLVKAERWYVNSQLAGGLKDRASRLNFDFAIVNRQLRHFQSIRDN